MTNLPQVLGTFAIVTAAVYAILSMIVRLGKQQTVEAPICQHLRPAGIKALYAVLFATGLTTYHFTQIEGFKNALMHHDQMVVVDQLQRLNSYSSTPPTTQVGSGVSRP